MHTWLLLISFFIFYAEQDKSPQNTATYFLNEFSHINTHNQKISLDTPIGLPHSYSLPQ